MTGWDMKHLHELSLLALFGVLVGACGDDDPPPPGDVQLQVRITNLTNAQPLSPVAVIMHRSGFNSFMDGEVASTALEILAEGGDNTDVLSEARDADEHVASGTTVGPVPPRTISPPVTLTVPFAALTDLRLTVLSMLVHTNDAFTGVNAAGVGSRVVSGSVRLTGPTWDAGTEANNERGDSMPGPDFAGEGFNAARDDPINRVRFHQGVVTQASVESGFAASSLLERHRFDNPTSRIVVTRVP